MREFKVCPFCESIRIVKVRKPKTNGYRCLKCKESFLIPVMKVCKESNAGLKILRSAIEERHRKKLEELKEVI
jgi:transposase-like protein